MKQLTGKTIYQELSNKYNLPVLVIKVICNHPFMFANKVISNGDNRSLMFTYLGKIKLKKIYERKEGDNDKRKES